MPILTVTPPPARPSTPPVSRRCGLARGARPRAPRDRRSDRAHPSATGRGWSPSSTGRSSATPTAPITSAASYRWSADVTVYVSAPTTAAGSAARCTSRCSGCSPARALTRRARHHRSQRRLRRPARVAGVRRVGVYRDIAFKHGRWRSSAGGRRRCASTATASGPARSARRPACRSLICHRQVERERRAVDEHPPGVVGGDRGDDRQPQAGPGRSEAPSPRQKRSNS